MLVRLVLGLAAEEGEGEAALDVVVAVDGGRDGVDDALADPLVLRERDDGLGGETKDSEHIDHWDIALDFVVI